ncbi:MAG: DNA integrity scanning protein DisA nucleotide-binding domain protein, partial [Treponema sp.]|nr:DNA integrity scanning protein DisA nucleotide-binding domain protein [Treponema sp.]
EQSDAVILVVSEETGAISIAFDGKLYYDLGSAGATQKLKELLERGVRSVEGEQTVLTSPGAEVSPVETGKDVILEP